MKENYMLPYGYTVRHRSVFVENAYSTSHLVGFECSMSFGVPQGREMVVPQSQNAIRCHQHSSNAIYYD